MRKLMFVLLLALAGAGCTFGPNYARPDLDVPAEWRVEESEAKELADTAWWGQFNDPVLNGLIETALRENKDLLIAAARIEEFAARYGIVRADLFPQVGAGASYIREQVTREGAGCSDVRRPNFCISIYGYCTGYLKSCIFPSDHGHWKKTASAAISPPLWLLVKRKPCGPASPAWC